MDRLDSLCKDPVAERSHLSISSPLKTRTEVVSNAFCICSSVTAFGAEQTYDKFFLNKYLK